MNRPTECRWCKSGVRLNGQYLTFKCWTIFLYHAWSQSPECKLKLAEDRIQRAVEVLEGVARFDVIPWDGGVSRDPSDGGGEVDADVVDQVIEILKGETDGKAE